MQYYDVFQIALERQAELEREMRRKELLRDAGAGDGRTVGARVRDAARRFAGRERISRATPIEPAYVRSSCVHEPA